MLRSALTAVRSAALHPDYCKQLNIVPLSRLFGTNFRFYTAQSTPDAANSSKDDASTEQKTIEPEKKAQETKESEHDRLLKEKNALLQDLQVRNGLVLTILKLRLIFCVLRLTSVYATLTPYTSPNPGNGGDLGYPPAGQHFHGNVPSCPRVLGNFYIAFLIQNESHEKICICWY